MPDIEPRIRHDAGYIDGKKRRDWLLLIALACYIGAFVAVVIVAVTA